MGFGGDDMAVRLQQQTMQMQQVSVVMYEIFLQLACCTCILLIGGYSVYKVFKCILHYAANAASVSEADADDYAAAIAGSAGSHASTATSSAGTSAAVPRAGTLLARILHKLCNFRHVSRMPFWAAFHCWAVCCSTALCGSSIQLRALTQSFAADLHTYVLHLKSRDHHYVDQPAGFAI